MMAEEKHYGSQRMLISSRVSPAGPHLLALRGHLDEQTQAGVAQAIEKSFSQGCHNIILDMADLHYITSSGFSAIIREWERAQQQGGDLVILNPPPNIQMVFKVLHLTDLVTIANNMDAANRHFSALAGLPDALPMDDEPAPLPGDG